MYFIIGFLLLIVAISAGELLRALVHEASHALACLLVRVKITDFRVDWRHSYAVFTNGLPFTKTVQTNSYVTFSGPVSLSGMLFILVAPQIVAVITAVPASMYIIHYVLDASQTSALKSFLVCLAISYILCSLQALRIFIDQYLEASKLESPPNKRKFGEDGSRVALLRKLKDGNPDWGKACGLNAHRMK